MTCSPLREAADQAPPPSVLGPLWWVVAGWAELPRLRWRGVPSLAVRGVLAQVPSRGCAAGVGLAAHSVPLQRFAPEGAPGKSASLWQLGIEAQELTTAIGQLAEQLRPMTTTPVPRPRRA